MGRMKDKSSARPSATPVYSKDIHRPVSSLAFLLPLVIVYEFGTWWVSPDPAAADESRVIAFRILNRFLALFGATEVYLPGLALLAILAAWHVATSDTWRFRRRTIGLMTLESLLLAIPLVVWSNIIGSLLSAGGGEHTVLDDLLLSVGAGIYEELLFRLMLISLLCIVLINLAKVPEGPAIFVIVLISAATFSLYHYLGQEPFAWSMFFFRAFAGGYLAGIFILRGFGITVGCHVMYNVLAIGLNVLAK